MLRERLAKLKAELEAAEEKYWRRALELVLEDFTLTESTRRHTQELHEMACCAGPIYSDEAKRIHKGLVNEFRWWDGEDLEKLYLRLKNVLHPNPDAMWKLQFTCVQHPRTAVGLDSANRTTISVPKGQHGLVIEKKTGN